LNKQAALLDWDGTLRKGFTMADWIRFLVKHNYFNIYAADRLKNLFQNYESGADDYSVLATQAANIYATGLAGKSVDYTRELAKNFVQLDREIYEFVPRLFSMLHNHNICIIVVSGVPQVVLEEFKVKFGMNVVFGIQAYSRLGHWTKRVLLNPASSEGKLKKVSQLIKTYDIVLSLGDTEADTPLLTIAKLPLIMKRQDIHRNESFNIPNGIYVDDNTLLKTVETAFS